MAKVKAKPKEGPRRIGRPLGSRNKLTIIREKKAALAMKTAVKKMTSQHTPEELAAMDPVDIMVLAMRTQALAGDFVGAAAIARDCAGYFRAKKMVETVAAGLPAELMPDPAPCGDEPAPANPIL